MANQESERVVRRTFDLLNQPQLPADFDQVIDPNWDNHAPAFFSRGPQGFKDLHDFWHRGFSNFSMTPEKLISDGDHVAAHFTIRGTHTGDFMGIPPTGKQINITAIGMYRVQNGKLAEAWVNPDRLALLQQLGVVQAPGQPQERAA